MNKKIVIKEINIRGPIFTTGLVKELIECGESNGFRFIESKGRVDNRLMLIVDEKSPFFVGIKRLMSIPNKRYALLACPVGHLRPFDECYIGCEKSYFVAKDRLVKYIHDLESTERMVFQLWDMRNLQVVLCLGRANERPLPSSIIDLRSIHRLNEHQP